VVTVEEGLLGGDSSLPKSEWVLRGFLGPQWVPTGSIGSGDPVGTRDPLWTHSELISESRDHECMMGAAHSDLPTFGNVEALTIKSEWVPSGSSSGSRVPRRSPRPVGPRAKGHRGDPLGTLSRPTLSLVVRAHACMTGSAYSSDLLTFGNVEALQRIRNVPGTVPRTKR
jgi:hypothetical protein